MRLTTCAVLMITMISVLTVGVPSESRAWWNTEIQVLNHLANTADSLLNAPSGEVEITNWPTVYPDTAALSVLNLINAILRDSVEVRVANFPTTQEVHLADVIHAIIDSLPPITFSGSQPVTLTQGATVGITNWPAMWQDTQPVTIENVVHAIIDSLPAITFNGSQPVTLTDGASVAVLSVPAINLNGSQPVTLTDGSLINILNWPAMWQTTQPVSIADVLHVIVDSLPAISFNGTQPVELTNGASINVLTLPAVSLNGSQPVTLTEGASMDILTMPAVSLNGSQPVTLTDGATVKIDSTIKVKTYSTDTIPVSVVTMPVAVVQRWPEIVNPFDVYGNYSVTLVNVPVECMVTNLSDTDDVRLCKMFPAGPVSYKIRPGQTVTVKDGAKEFDFYSASVTVEVQMYSTYEATTYVSY